ncbi:MAG: heat-inducible transcriptional repressor HrcA [Eubacteriales bacterium]|nr:heat-inducible transcriptional repressor HrcA [Bacillota bacterium]MBV1727912.1 heat-inducible transcriptional repressor HrcA [Desulforudis sp.]MDQ7789643.1 heat-inducible transcriptional repressor HrcA [Clostridia bacterium]MDZ4042750.1 heat-inducible transcriptional repressor HrcA [Eubacteriales bacterium]MBU4553482.1 heat-inducible transcriptional repressor HrcA [Bacillota bacterium]
MTLDERKKRILWAIIQDYIATAEPVGSRTLARKYKLGVSSATVRNEMADLEEMGFLEQPHTSAGRVPSHRGYRFYVDHLMQPEKLQDSEKELVRVSFETKVKMISEVIQRTGQLLTQLSSYTAMVVSPCASRTRLRHIQLVPMSRGQAMLLVVLEPGIVQHRMMELPPDLTVGDLEMISRVVNEKIKGSQMSDLKLTIIREIYAELLRHKSLVAMMMDLIEDSSRSKEDRIYLGGIFNILNEPEFNNVERVKTLLGILEQEELICNILNDQDQPGVNVRIGSEISCEDIKDCSMIGANYEVDGQRIGSIAVLGPTRMQYAKAISVVEYLTANLNEIMSKMYRS